MGPVAGRPSGKTPPRINDCVANWPTVPTLVIAQVAAVACFGRVLGEIADIHNEPPTGPAPKVGSVRGQHPVNAASARFALTHTVKAVNKAVHAGE